MRFSVSLTDALRRAGAAQPTRPMRFGISSAA